ncbi:MAG: hypothetical protein ABI880_05975 [Acidobacteriota bacterium]
MQELSVRDVVLPLWRARFRLVAVALASAVVTLGYVLSLRSPYEATAVVRAIESKSGDQVEPARAENFRPLLENKTIAAEIVKDFGLVAEPRYVWGSSSGPIPADALIQSVLSVDQVAGTNLLRVRVRLADAELAAKVANAIVSRAIALNKRINQEEVVEARDYIRSQLDEASVRLEHVRQELVATKQRFQVEALQRDADGALDARSRLIELQASIENERSFLARSAAALASSNQLITTRRTIDHEPALAEAARERAPGAPLLGLTMSDEQANPAHASLEQQVSESSAKLAGLESERHLLVDQKRLDKELPVLGRLYEGDLAVSRLQAEYETALKVYADLSIRDSEARIRVGSRGAQLQLVDPALPPTVKTATPIVSAVALAALAGGLAACLAVLVIQFLSPLLLRP